MRSNMKRSFALSAAVLLVASSFAWVHAQDLPRADNPAMGRICMEIHDTVRSRGIPVISVRPAGGTIEVVLGEPCSEAQRAEAEQIKNDVIRYANTPTVADNLTDALVVLRYEPDNASARQLVRSRYEALRAASRAR